MGSMGQMYKKPLEEVGEKIVSEQEIRDIFANVEELFQLNKKLMRDLERSKNKSDLTVSDVFLEMVWHVLPLPLPRIVLSSS